MAITKSVGVRFPLDIYLKILEYCTKKDITFTDYVIYKVVTSDDLVNKKIEDLSLSSNSDNSKKITDLENTISSLISQRKQLSNNINSLERNLSLQDKIVSDQRNLLSDIKIINDVLFIINDIYPVIVKNVKYNETEPSKELRGAINIIDKQLSRLNKIVKEKDISNRIDKMSI
jgi:hypothetical protein